MKWKAIAAATLQEQGYAVIVCLTIPDLYRPVQLEL